MLTKKNLIRLLSAATLVLAVTFKTSASTPALHQGYLDVNTVKGKSDSERINRAIRQSNGKIIIPRRVSTIEPERDWWLLDEAILLPSNTTVIISNCRIKLSDRCRDNFFRSANCGLGIEENEMLVNIHIIGEGTAVLEGADHPRSTGDGEKNIRKTSPHDPTDWIQRAYWLTDEEKKTKKTAADVTFWDIHMNTYGTDALKSGESQLGDWRNIGILLASVKGFSIENIRIKHAHAWNISLENCSRGLVSRIDFENYMWKEIDGVRENIENQDGIDVRNGCHDITISDITGHTGDDVVALTAIANSKEPYMPGGSFGSTHVMHNDWTRRSPDIHHITIRNVRASSEICNVMRLLAVESHIHDIVIDGVVNMRENRKGGGTILIGDGNFYGAELPDGISNVMISNVIGSKVSGHPIYVAGYLQNSTITNIISPRPNVRCVGVAKKDGLKNVLMSNLLEVTE